MDNRAFPRPERNSIPLRRAALALMTATGLAILCLGAGLLLIVNLGLEGGCACVIPSPQSQLWMLATMAGGVGGVAVPLGFSTWRFLHLIGRESGPAYLVAGTLEGLACTALIAYALAGKVGPRQLPAFLVFGALGAFISLAFWRLALGAKGVQ